MIVGVSAKLSNARLSDQKARLVADQIRGLSLDKALNLLKFSNKKAAKMMKKLLESAIANAENNENMDIDELVVKTIQVNQAATLKRFRARAKGRGTRILKRNCHIEIIVDYKKAA